MLKTLKQINNEKKEDVWPPVVIGKVSLGEWLRPVGRPLSGLLSRSKSSPSTSD